MKYHFYNFDYDTYTNEFDFKQNQFFEITKTNEGIHPQEALDFYNKRQKYYAQGLKDIDALYLFMTDECDGSCKYCYIKSNINNQKKLLTFDVFKNSFDKLIKKHIFADDVIVRFVGGDPALSNELIPIVNYLNSKLNNAQFDFFFALLNTEDQYQKLLQTLDSFSNLKVSLKLTADFGSPSCSFTRTPRHNEYLPKIKLYSRIIEIIKRYQNFNISIKTNISKYTELEVLIEDLKYFKNEILDFKDNTELLFNVVRDEIHSPSKLDLERLLQYFYDYYFWDIYTYNDKEFGINIGDLPFDFLEKHYEEYVSGTKLNPLHLSCKTFKSAILIRPNGTLGNCLLDYIKDYNYQYIHFNKDCHAFIGDEFMNEKYQECSKCDLSLVCTLCPITKKYLNCDQIPAFKSWEEFLFLNKLKLIDEYLERL